MEKQTLERKADSENNNSTNHRRETINKGRDVVDDVLNKGKAKFDEKFEEGRENMDKTRTKFDEGFDKSKEKSKETFEKGMSKAEKLADELGKNMDELFISLKTAGKDFDSKLNDYRENSPKKIDLDLIEFDNKYYIKADVPGMKKEDVNIEVTEDTVSISCFFEAFTHEVIGKTCEELNAEAEESEEEIEKPLALIKGRKFGNAKREIKLPKKVDIDNVTAKYHKGTVTLTIPQIAVKKVNVDL